MASILRLIPGWREKRIDRAEGDWRNNRDAIDRDLGPKPWWVRHDDPRNEYDRGR